MTGSSARREHERPCAMVVLSAGQGKRFGAGLPKQYRSAGGAQGETPLIAFTFQRLAAHPLIDAIQPVIGPNDRENWDRLTPFLEGIPGMRPPVTGGKERQDSVRLGLEALKGGYNSWVGIHDGVRPILPQEMLDRLLAARADADALIAAIPATDTLKRVDKAGTILDTVDRSAIWQAQTPQIFRYGVILEAHREAHRAGFLGTDDASLLESRGIPVKVVPGDRRNIKITRPEDLPLAAHYLQEDHK